MQLFLFLCFVARWLRRWWRLLSAAVEVIDPYSRLYFAWLGVIASFVLYNFVCLVFRSVFWQSQERYLPLWLTVDYLSDAIYALDMVVRSKTGQGATSLADRLAGSLSSWLTG